MKMNKMLYVTVTLVVMLFIATGCQKQDYDNKYFKVSDEFINGYGSEYYCVYVQNNEGLFVIADGTDMSVYEKYGVGLDCSEEFSDTGIYLPLKREYKKVKALLSYGDVAPVVLSKKRDKLYSIEDHGCLTFHPVEFIEKADYANAMKKYNQPSDGFKNVGGCRIYEVSDEEINVNPLETASDGGTIYDIGKLKPGLYYVDDTYGVVEIVK